MAIFRSASNSSKTLPFANRLYLYTSNDQMCVFRLERSQKRVERRLEKEFCSIKRIYIHLWFLKKCHVSYEYVRHQATNIFCQSFKKYYCNPAATDLG